jgi:hypothetical protein
MYAMRLIIPNLPLDNPAAHLVAERAEATSEIRRLMGPGPLSQGTDQAIVHRVCHIAVQARRLSRAQSPPVRAAHVHTRAERPARRAAGRPITREELSNARYRFRRGYSGDPCRVHVKAVAPHSKDNRQLARHSKDARQLALDVSPQPTTSPSPWSEYQIDLEDYIAGLEKTEC